MLFFKPKPKSAELIPPPPLDFEEELKEKPKFFDEIIKKPKSETFTEEEEFNRLVKELNEGLKPLSKKVKIIPKKKRLNKKQKISKKEIKKLKKITKKKIQSKRLIKVRPIKQVKKQKGSLPEEGFDLENLDFGLPKKLEKSKKEIGFPETLEDFDIEGFEQKPKEILEAEEEIKSAIENIKKQERPSILKKLFSKKPKEEPEHLMPEFPAADNISRIKNKINEARQALMKFDLDTAKRIYIEVVRLYNNISPEDKAKVYNDIKELYFERKSAEELRV